MLVAEFTKARNPAFHHSFFALLNLGFEYWDPTGGAISSNERKLVTGYVKYQRSAAVKVHCWMLLSSILTAWPVNESRTASACANLSMHTALG